MADRWRPSFDSKYFKKLKEFLEAHPEFPFEEPRELMKHCTDEFITDTVRTTKTDEDLKNMLKNQDLE